MQFVYVKEACGDVLELDVKAYAHIFKVRRMRLGASLHVRNLLDDILYTYIIESIDRKKALLRLVTKKESACVPKKSLHVGWCVIDPKTIEKTLPMLNEMGVGKISFVYAQFSQKNFQIDMQRLNRILISSCEQCGRTVLMELECISNVQEYLTLYPQSAIVDFSQSRLNEDATCSHFLIGCEGGFSQEERALFCEKNIFGLDSQLILRSESAVVGVCAKMLL
ncbi:MAG: 16S rRNA (uracil(1498)-N(3))-methyltransferase [Sulfurospirillum sp.]|nr:16S rRNA (uracil(1498)-N(3))-methyltransferase [Sulfurospirillum sp.]